MTYLLHASKIHNKQGGREAITVKPSFAKADPLVDATVPANNKK